MKQQAKAERKIKNIFVQGPITPERIAQSIANHSGKHAIGAHEIFLGQIRADIDTKDTTDTGNRVSAIEYTAYTEMALEAMHEIREETFSKFDITCMHVYHSLGEIKTGELCFFVFASAPHRVAAREAVAYLVDSIKEKLPIFGKELFADETHQWKVNK